MASWIGIEVPFWFVVAIGLGLVLLVSLLSLQVSEGSVSAVHLSEAPAEVLSRRGWCACFCSGLGQSVVTALHARLLCRSTSAILLDAMRV